MVGSTECDATGREAIHRRVHACVSAVDGDFRAHSTGCGEYHITLRELSLNFILPQYPVNGPVRLHEEMVDLE
jgi:hypothetical protein